MHINILEEEAIHIFRETAAQLPGSAILFSGGKDSTVLIHLAIKAFYPSLPPFKIIHVDTGHNFPEALAFRDHLCSSLGLELIVRKVEDTILGKKLQDATGKLPSRNMLQSYTLLDVIAEFSLPGCIGGGRRDEEKARAKERIFSFRNTAGAWDPYAQRPELWNIYNGRVKPGEHVRVFPLSNWSELDIWNYIRTERISLPSLYFAHDRRCLVWENKLIAVSEYINIEPGDEIVDKRVRYRTVGDMTCTAAIESNAATIDEVIYEIENTHISERGQTRIDDNLSENAMEERKLNGYF